MSTVQREFRPRHAGVAAWNPTIARLPWRERQTAEGCLVRYGDELVRLNGGMRWARHIELSCSAGGEA